MPRVTAPKRERLPLATPLVVFILIALLDPFGLYSVSNKVSRELAFRALSLWQNGEGRRKVAVVLLDDVSADALNGEFGYPVTFHNHAGIARTILCPGPASLFLDFSFRNIRTRNLEARASHNGREISADLEEFVRALATRALPGDRFCPPIAVPGGRRSAGATAVYLARTRSLSPDACDPLFEDYPGGKPLPSHCRAAREISSLRSVVEPLTLARADPEGAYLVTVPPAATYAALPDGVDGSKPKEMSPALASVLAFCASLPSSEAQRFRGCRERGSLAAYMQEGEASRLTPLWGYFRHSSGRDERLADRCKASQIAGEDNLPGRIWMVLSEVGRALVRGQTDRSSDVFGQGLCLPFETVTALELINRGTNCGGRDRAACRLDQASVTAGRMVFYGASVADVHDVYESPVLGIVPGVAVHAMAAANLLEHGTAYLREPPEYGLAGLRLEGGQIVEIGVLVAWFMVLMRLQPRLLVGSGGTTLGRRLGFHVWIALVAAGLALAVTAIMYGFFYWTPANWLGLAVALAGTRPDAVEPVVPARGGN